LSAKSALTDDVHTWINANTINCVLLCGRADRPHYESCLSVRTCVCSVRVPNWVKTLKTKLTQIC